jgi:hypothetical protein
MVRVSGTLRLSRLAPILHPLASNYLAAAMIGCMAGAFVYCVMAAVQPTSAYNHSLILALLLSGTIAGCLATFAARRLIELIVRFSKSAAPLEQPLSVKTKAALVTAMFAFVFGGILTLAAGDIEPPSPRGKCYFSNRC